MAPHDPELQRVPLDEEREKLLEQLADWLELPMDLLGFVWLGLLVVEFIWGLSPLLEGIGLVIWGMFIVNFALEFTLAPNKLRYLRGNWLSTLALLLPALRVFRIAWMLRLLQASRGARGLRLFRLISSLNRGIRSLRSSLARRGFGYVVLLTAIVAFTGAAGMYAF